jgi:uncharacterized membrane protein
MSILLIGLILFLGVHSVRIVAEPWRTQTRARLGEGPYKGLYALTAGVGLALTIWGYSLARAEPTLLWVPPIWTRHIAALLMLPAFVLLAAAYVPGNSVKAAVKHPMLLGVKVWAFSHLVANQMLADVFLFGGFLVWAVLCFRAARQRDRAEGTVYPAGRLVPTLITVVVGMGLWAATAFWAHGVLFGVKPFGG